MTLFTTIQTRPRLSKWQTSDSRRLRGAFSVSGDALATGNLRSGRNFGRHLRQFARQGIGGHSGRAIERLASPLWRLLDARTAAVDERLRAGFAPRKPVHGCLAARKRPSSHLRRGLVHGSRVRSGVVAHGTCCTRVLRFRRSLDRVGVSRLSRRLGQGARRSYEGHSQPKERPSKGPRCWQGRGRVRSQRMHPVTESENRVTY